MFAYEMHQAHRAELQQRADDWRLAREAKAARTAERRARAQARRTQAGAAVRTDAEGASSSTGPLGRFHRAMHPHGAA